ncbi:amino acid adenylation domain-containing protein [Allokutzneria albata]|uniref:Amino acid adenylation domain-containing protein n=1 Tax=Allokutzneria albata TaxID=211114 RepID=A0A1G9Y6C4_ALLAB|nr:amino acid adenylation domain-containing protein [Allokutzneria albata]SDN04644.1 amino acid adenylation domain-containing protein [Allokutzneria albata]
MNSQTLIHRFDAVAAACGDSTAVEFDGAELTYTELRQASQRMAARLAEEFGIINGDRVAIHLEPGLDIVVAILAILRCGAAYVPLDVDSPADRNSVIVADCKPRGILGDVAFDHDAKRLAASSVRDLWRSGGAAVDTPSTPEGTGADTAYVIYTSGTTGRPKGVPVTHRNLLALFDATSGLFDVGPDDRWLLYHSFAFDFSVWELWGPLLTGGRSVVLDKWDKLSPDLCAELITARGITVLSQTPTAFGILGQELRSRTGQDGLALRYVVFGGERLIGSALLPWVERFGLDQPRLVNMYGLTEATVHTTFHRITAANLTSDASVIGKPLPGFVCKVVADGDAPGDHGELLVSGPQVTGGYLNRPELTAERFGRYPADRSDSPVFYRTGDVVEWRDGVLVHLGRADNQVKIRGHRIEIGEVEVAATAVRDVQRVCVALVDRDGVPVLACAYTTGSGKPIPPREFRNELATRIPRYMVPDRYRLFAEFPLTVNGKVDTAVITREMESSS